MTITYEEFEKVDIRSGTIVKAENFLRAKKPSYKIWVDFGKKIGIKQTSAQVTFHYSLESLIGLRIIGCVNLDNKNIAGFVSEFLLLGFEDENNSICLAVVDLPIPNGQKIC